MNVLIQFLDLRYERLKRRRILSNCEIPILIILFNLVLDTLVNSPVVAELESLIITLLLYLSSKTLFLLQRRLG